MFKIVKVISFSKRSIQIPLRFLSSKANTFNDYSAMEDLFNNSERTHKPVQDSETLLKKFRIEGDMKTFAQKKSRISDKKPKEFRTSREDNPVAVQSKPKPIIKEKSYKVKDEETGLEITILGLNDKLTNNVFTNIRSKKQRDKNGKIVIEGRRLILDALSAGIKPEMVFFSDREQLKLIKEDLRPFKKLEIYKVPRHDLKIWSTLITTPGILAIFPRPDENFHVQRQTESVPLTVICDNIREPSNLGSIIRSCAAIPCHQIIILKGSCDPWDTKCLRGGCGAQFRVDIRDDVKWEHLENEDFFPPGSKFFLAESNLNRSELFEQVDYSKCEYSMDHNVLVLGGETHGLSEDAYRFLKSQSNGKLLHIPLAKGVDSLNSASALTVLLFHIRNILETQ